MPQERKPFPWIWRSLIFAVTFLGLFYVSYLRNVAFSWGRFVGPLILTGIAVALGGVSELFCRTKRIRLARTDWLGRISQFVVFTVVVLGFMWCAVLGGYVARKDGIGFTVCFFIVTASLELIRGWYHNDRSQPSDGNTGIPRNLPSLPYLFFPSDRTKRR